MRDSRARSATWPFRLGTDEHSGALHDALRRAGEASQYGWGHTMDFGAFRIDGILGDQYLEIAAAFDEWGWWPRDLTGRVVADVGAFSGGISLLMAARGASRVLAVDEVPEHLDQCRAVATGLGVAAVEPILSSLYELPRLVPPRSLDLVVLSGVLYHLSDMLVGLVAVRELLKPGGRLLMETYAIECFEHSYANFARFCGGAWWRPTALCIQDLLQFAGLARGELRFYKPDRCLVATTYEPGADRILYKRGMNYAFASRRDEVSRESGVETQRMMPPVPCRHD